MSDNYQAVYDAVRSRFHPFNSGQLIDVIARNFDISHAVSMLQQEISNIGYEYTRPSVLYRPSLSIDGNQWCALYGENLQDGVAGFGNSPAQAMLDFDKQFCKG